MTIGGQPMHPMGFEPYTHPGEPALARVMFIRVGVDRVRRLHVAPGQDLYAEIHDQLERYDADGCVFTLVGGSVAELDIMTGGAVEAGAGIGFVGPHCLAGPYTVVAGAGSTGIGSDGAPTTHCHAVFATADGRHVGGHLIAGRTIGGPAGIQLDLTILRDGHFVQRLDPETQFNVFHPEAA